MFEITVGFVVRFAAAVHKVMSVNVCFDLTTYILIFSMSFVFMLKVQSGI